jgi:N-acetylneuraminate lyase
MSFSLNEMKGVIPALVTCFDERENFDPVRMRKTVRFLLEKGVHGLYLTGSTGECFLMTPGERKEVVETVIDEVKGCVPVIVHIGAVSTRISSDLACHARKAGADAVSSVPPFYWNFSKEDIIHYYEAVTDAAELPMFVYNVPLAGNLGTPLLQRLVKIPGVSGIKFTLPAHHEILRIRQDLGPDFVIFSGVDEMAMSGLDYGADGLIGSFYNLIPEVFLKLYQASHQGDKKTALAMQKLANQVIYLALEYDYIGMLKQMMAWKGIDAGYARSPFYKYSISEMEIILQRFIALGLAETLGLATALP